MNQHSTSILEAVFSDDGSHTVVPPEIDMAAEVTGGELINWHLAKYGRHFPDDLLRPHILLNGVL